jgi:lipopolysaccharide/colanic/teichoic acid biosynthesis glycosyltransferase
MAMCVWLIHFGQTRPPSVLELPKLLATFKLLQFPNLNSVFIKSLISLVTPRLTRYANLVLFLINLETCLAVTFGLATFPEFSFVSEFVERSRHFCFQISVLVR